jgi:hypothetical protein
VSRSDLLKSTALLALFALPSRLALCSLRPVRCTEPRHSSRVRAAALPGAEKLPKGTPAEAFNFARASEPRPPGYEADVRALLDALQASLALEATGVSEIEVRRKAEPAKAAVQSFLRAYRPTDARLQSLASYAATCSALRLLSEFYQAKGGLSRLGGSPEGDAVRQKLDEAQLLLEEELRA